MKFEYLYLVYLNYLPELRPFSWRGNTIFHHDNNIEWTVRKQLVYHVSCTKGYLISVTKFSRSRSWERGLWSQSWKCVDYRNEECSVLIGMVKWESFKSTPLFVGSVTVRLHGQVFKDVGRDHETSWHQKQIRVSVQIFLADRFVCRLTNFDFPDWTPPHNLWHYLYHPTHRVSDGLVSCDLLFSPGDWRGGHMRPDHHFPYKTIKTSHTEHFTVTCEYDHVLQWMSYHWFQDPGTMKWGDGNCSETLESVTTEGPRRLSRHSTYLS